MKNPTAKEARLRLNKCVDSVHKQIALRDLRTATVAARQGDAIAADKLIMAAFFHLHYAEAITRRLNSI